ncbi:hypothetical protein ACO1O0_001636 [Amphichorda felina]
MPRQRRKLKRPTASRPRRNNLAREAPVSQQPKPLYFWKETDPATGFLAPWYQSPFTDGDDVWISVGEYVTQEKARLFGDREAYNRIGSSNDISEQRFIGNNIKNFDEEVWKQKCFEIAKIANALKFHFPVDKDSNIRERLEATGDRELVDATPHDRLWGIGFRAADAKKTDRKEWGQNLYGKAVMDIRRDGITDGDPVMEAILQRKEALKKKHSKPQSSVEIDVSQFDVGGRLSIWW